MCFDDPVPFVVVDRINLVIYRVMTIKTMVKGSHLRQAIYQDE
jgi:hypothetical protein